MCEKSQKKPSIEIGDIFRKHADAYIREHGVSAVQNKAIKAITRCRTAELGGHVMQCNHCKAQEISYNSCRYRHCPKCQTTKKLQWLDARKDELLPVEYFHVVFTLPHELNNLASYNQAIIYNLLFQSAWYVVQTLGEDKKRLDGRMGMLSFLHTWGQNLSQHNHLHCMIPGGALGEDKKKQKIWHASRKGYLFPVKVMSKLFGKAFQSELRKAYEEKRLTFKGCISNYGEPKEFEKLMWVLSKKSWNVYAKPPFKGGEGGVEYLARYVSKIAIGNERIVSLEDEKVTFRWRDYADHNKSKLMTLEVFEFMRRYLSHILPERFMRVRSFGFLANACRAKCIDVIRTLINRNDEPTKEKSKEKETAVELIKRYTGIDIRLCKECQIGQLEKVEILSGIKMSRSYSWDTS